MSDVKVRTVAIYKFYVDGEEKNFKNPIMVDIKHEKDYIIFSVEEGDLMLHTVANNINDGLKDVLEILEGIWKLYVLAELADLSQSAIEFADYFKSLVH